MIDHLPLIPHWAQLVATHSSSGGARDLASFRAWLATVHETTLWNEIQIQPEIAAAIEALLRSDPDQIFLAVEEYRRRHWELVSSTPLFRGLVIGISAGPDG